MPSDVTLFARLTCAVRGHDRRYVRAEDLQNDLYTRSHRDGSTETVGGCTIIDQCKRCGHERDVLAPLSTVRLYDLSKSWEGDDGE